jgi:hypothetical protein
MRTSCFCRQEPAGTLCRVSAARAGLFLALVLGNAPASAQQPASPVAPDSARDLFARGQAAYQQGDYESAVGFWTRAYALEARPQLQFNLSQAYSRLGRVEEERAALLLFVERSRGDEPSLAAARARLVMLEQRLARTGVVLEGTELDGATVLIDGEDRGRLPHPEPFSLRPGSHEVRVTLAGYEPFRATIVVPAGEAVAVEVTMARATVAVASEGSVALPVTMLGLGGALVLTGSVFGGLALAGSDGVVRGSDDADRAHTFSIASDVMLGVGVAAGATGLVLFLTRRGDEAEQPGAAILPVLGRDVVGIQTIGRF